MSLVMKTSRIQPVVESENIEASTSSNGLRTRASLKRSCSNAEHGCVKKCSGSGRRPNPVHLKCCICGSMKSDSYCMGAYRFPANAEKRDAWLRSLKMKKSELQEKSRLCSRHFREGKTDNVPVRELVYAPPDAEMNDSPCESSSSPEQDLCIDGPPSLENSDHGEIDEASSDEGFLPDANGVLKPINSTCPKAHSKLKESQKEPEQRIQLQTTDQQSIPQQKSRPEMLADVANVIKSKLAVSLSKTDELKKSLDDAKSTITELEKKVKSLPLEIATARKDGQKRISVANTTIKKLKCQKKMLGTELLSLMKRMDNDIDIKTQLEEALSRLKHLKEQTMKWYDLNECTKEVVAGNVEGELQTGHQALSCADKKFHGS